MPILDKRTRLTPYEYPQFAEAHLAVMHSPWSPFEVAMSTDLLDWSKISKEEKATIAGILMGFTLQEAGIGCYWRNTVANQFSLPEIVNMATAFSAQEAVHARAYAHLEDTLGLDTYSAFEQDAIACAKLDAFIGQEASAKDLASSLAIFSGAGEGVSLYASFAILLSFAKKGQFKGMQQILSWSVLDEELHSKMGIELYKLLIKEYPELEPDKAIIYEGFELIVRNEHNFVYQAFSNGDLATISLAEAQDFIDYRANKKLMELGLEPIFELSNEYLKVKQFFDTMVLGKTMNDFFAQSRNGSGYSAVLTQDFIKQKFKKIVKEIPLSQPNHTSHYYEAYCNGVLIGYWPNADKLIFPDWLQDMQDIAIYGCTKRMHKAKLARLAVLQKGLQPEPIEYYLQQDTRQKYD